MKTQLILGLALVCSLLGRAQPGALNIQLIGHWNDTTLDSHFNDFSQDIQIWNDLTGWTNPVDGKEYVIMGSIDSTYFFDISNPADIKKCAVYPGRTRSTNRDYDVYKNYVYCVSDNGPPGVLQIIDLQYLPDSIHVIVEDSSIASRTHSLVIDSNNNRMYFHASSRYDVNGTGTVLRYDMLILSLDSPESPRVIGELKSPECGRVHEAYYRNDTGYCSCEYRGLHIFDMRRADSIKYIGGVSPPYPYNGFNHTNWVDPTGKFVVFNDEIPAGLPIKLYSMNLQRGELDFETLFNSNTGATPHNIIWKGNLLYTSAYEDGMVIWDMSNPYNPVKKAYYDTYPQNAVGSYHGFTGCWGVYPFFKSGIIAASDMRNGLFLMKYDETVGLPEDELLAQSLEVYPNPFDNLTTLKMNSSTRQEATVTVCTLDGKIILTKHFDLLEGENELKLEEVSGWAQGVYLLQILTTDVLVHHRMVKQ